MQNSDWGGGGEERREGTSPPLSPSLGCRAGQLAGLLEPAAGPPRRNKFSAEFEIRRPVHDHANGGGNVDVRVIGSRGRVGRGDFDASRFLSGIPISRGWKRNRGEWIKRMVGIGGFFLFFLFLFRKIRDFRTSFESVGRSDRSETLLFIYFGVI